MSILKCLGRALAVSFVFVVLGLLTSCYPWFDNPLPIPKEGLKVDDQILGSWVSSTNYFIIEDSCIHIYPRASGWIDVFFIGTDSPSDKYGCTQYHGYTAKVGDIKVLCLWMMEHISEQGETVLKKSPKCMLFPYKVTDDGMLHIWFWDWEKLMKCVEDGKLKGEITRTTTRKRGRDEEQKYMQIQASSEELGSFFSTVGVGELIGKRPEMSFYRFNKPERKPFTPPEKP